MSIGSLYVIFVMLLSFTPITYLCFIDVVKPKIKRFKNRHITFNVVISDDLEGDLSYMLSDAIYNLHKTDMDEKCLKHLIKIQKSIEDVGKLNYNDDSSYHSLVKTRIVTFIQYVCVFDGFNMHEDRMWHQMKMMNDTLEMFKGS